MIETVLVKKEDIYKGYLILVNQNNLIKKPVLNLVKENDIELEKTTHHALKEVLKKINAQDKIVWVSGYRSLQEQKKLYQDSIEENGLEFTQKYVALPNASEHQTGLAIDLGLKQEVIDFICPSFPRDGICEEFRSLAPFYGFIERYTKEKEKITGISSEEWHFRYVGYPHSKIMEEKNMCLEEYIAYLKKFPFPKKLSYQNYEISYIPYEENMKIPKNVEISGNNQDGFIITRKVNEDENIR